MKQIASCFHFDARSTQQTHIAHLFRKLGLMLLRQKKHTQEMQFLKKKSFLLAIDTNLYN